MKNGYILRRYPAIGGGSSDALSELDRWFEGFFTPPTRLQLGPARGAVAAAPLPGFAPEYDVEENEAGFLMSFDLPGVPQSDVKVEVLDRSLKISGERRRQTPVTAADAGKAEPSRALVRSERRYGKFERVFALPDDVDAAKIEASFEDGVLRLLLPRAEKTKPRSVQIEIGKRRDGNGGALN